MILSDFVIVSLAIFGFTYLLRYFNGPFDALLKIRTLCGIAQVPILNTVGQQIGDAEDMPTKLAEFVGCYWCLTTWVSFVMFLVYVLVFGVDVVWLPFLWLAGVAVSGLLHDCAISICE